MIFKSYWTNFRVIFFLEEQLNGLTSGAIFFASVLTLTRLMKWRLFPFTSSLHLNYLLVGLLKNMVR